MLADKTWLTPFRPAFASHFAPEQNEQGDAGAVTYLRLESRRGWIANRRVDAVRCVARVIGPSSDELEPMPMFQRRARADELTKRKTISDSRYVASRRLKSDEPINLRLTKPLSSPPTAHAPRNI